jgi:hypothetical protein
MYVLILFSYSDISQGNNLCADVPWKHGYLYLSIYLSIYLSMALQPFVGPWPLFSFLIIYTVCRTPWTGDQPIARPLPIHRTTQTQNKRKQTSMSQVRFKPTTPVFERTKTVHALDGSAMAASIP